jgi:hypothetical protein
MIRNMVLTRVCIFSSDRVRFLSSGEVLSGKYRGIMDCFYTNGFGVFLCVTGREKKTKDAGEFTASWCSEARTAKTIPVWRRKTNTLAGGMARYCGVDVYYLIRDFYF